jgi:hypothetical protein
MKRTIGVTVMALGLLATGAFLSTFISNPFASNEFSASQPSEQTPILVNANGTQISVVPSISLDGKPAPVVINVGATGVPGYESSPPQAMPVPYRPMVQSAAYEPASRPRQAVRAGEANSGTRSWQKEAVIIGGGAAAGAGIGAIAGGKKGAAIGAISGGVAGLIYDLKTRKNGDRW